MDITVPPHLNRIDRVSEGCTCGWCAEPRKIVGVAEL
jgi:hypothetical protein